MKKKIIVSLLALFISTIIAFSAFADSKTVQLGETGISFQINSKYDVITNKNKKDYSQEIQRQITEDNEILLYSATDSPIFVMFDQGNDFLQYDMVGKKSEEIVESYTEYFKSIESSLGTSEYDLSVYDSGSIKWAKLFVPSISLVWYITCQEKQMATVYCNWFMADIVELQSMIDSFTFGSPSFWSSIKTIAGSITDFGNRILGRVGVYIIWSLIGSIVFGGFFFISEKISNARKKARARRYQN